MNHSEIIELLPWYANATLSEKERRLVDDHLRDCPDCVRELESNRWLKENVSAACAAHQAPPADLLERTMSALGEPAAPALAAVEPASRRGLWDAIWNPEPAIGRWAVAAALILGLATATLTLFSPGLGPTTGPRDGETLGGPVPGIEGGPEVLVAMQPSVSFEQIVAWLDENEARIIGGPIGYNGMTVFRVRLSPSADPTRLIEGADEDSAIRVVEWIR